MNLYLLRHAKAMELGTDGIRRDPDRPLAPEGEKKMRKIAVGLRHLELTFDPILSSPCLRARQTAEIVAVELDLQDRLQLTPHLAVEADLKALIIDINRQHHRAADVLLVGHEPSLGQLLSVLLTGSHHLTVNFRKAALAKVSVNALGWGRCATLEWFLSPSQLVRLGGD